MTIGGKLIAFFPLLHSLTIVSAILNLMRAPHVGSLFFLLFWIYVFPLICFHIHNYFFRLEEGQFLLSARTYSPWWGSHMIQLIFIAVPWLEAPLHFVPGLFSLWLKLWGSQVGDGVYWTPRVEIIDRGLVVVGGGTVLGHLTICCSHMVADIDGQTALVIKKVVIGEKCFIGADTQLGPGASVPPHTKLKPKTRLYWRGEWP